MMLGTVGWPEGAGMIQSIDKPPAGRHTATPAAENHAPCADTVPQTGGGQHNPTRRCERGKSVCFADVWHANSGAPEMSQSAQPHLAV